MTSVTATKAPPCKAAAKKAATKKAAPVSQPDPSFTISTRTFLRDLAEVKPFACTDYILPAIYCVRLVMKAGVLTFAATDRYVMGVVTETTAAGGDFEFSLPVPVLTRLQQVLKPQGRKDDPPLRITVGAKSISIEQASTITDLSPSVIVVPTQEAAFPDYSKIIDGHKAASELVPAVGINPRLVAKFAGVMRSNHSYMNVKFGENSNKPMLVTIGDYFVGILMPVRLPDASAAVRAA